MSQTIKRATVISKGLDYLLVQEPDVTQHWLAYHGQVQMNTPREPGSVVSLGWVKTAGACFPTAAPLPTT